MLRLIDRGEVGIVLVTDVSRLGRNGPDLEKLLHIVTEHDVLVYVDGKVYDPSSEELMELFALRMQGLFASFEQANRTRRLRDGKRERIKQGFAVSPPPSGLIEVIRGKWDLDPDPLVQASYQRIFHPPPGQLVYVAVFRGIGFKTQLEGLSQPFRGQLRI